MKRNPIEDALKIINAKFPNCQAALLAGSVVRGEATDRSDLDMVIFDGNLFAPYRESLIDNGWPIEAFVHNLTSYRDFFKSDIERGVPSLVRMVSEGVVLKGEDIIRPIKEEAKKLMEKGPEEWSDDLIVTKRYFLTDALDDFIGCTNRPEAIFIALTLANLASEFVLRVNGKWIGKSKWIFRSLKEYDEKFAERFTVAFDCFYKTNKKDKVIELVDGIMEPYGGRLFEGFSLGKIPGLM
ncbi:nucleotidyltransferase domain-containing protein [Neobacillus piezotolerans]|uniref:Nucleotidyltransferase domain-containing protein n=1 Tax=Neobacillus piezotolerans TaxID=2259171 RepID=A0A3D8GXL4_9BACI|nr:nucleotidyltransferase domain-containing protein [Neobacillus piezotolerans]RDU38939.1 nucleotidyltransferase domain-containing protein [Neobacillus piezotolerans]